MFVQKVFRFTRNAKILERSFSHRSFLSSRKRNTRYTLTTKLLNVSSFTAMGIWGLAKTKEESETVISPKEVLIAKADALFDQAKYKETYDLLSNYRGSGDVEIMWRLSRALYKMSKTASEVEGKKMIYEAYDLIQNALKVKEDHWAVHKWIAVILDSKCSFEGMKLRMEELYNMKKHMLRAIELNPADATTMYMLGVWCYQVSDLAWYQRKIVGVVFGEPPTSSFEEALKYFENAEKVDPNFYSHNLLMLGKTCLMLNKKEEGLKYLQMVIEYPAKNDDDHNAKQEAQKLLKSI